MFKTTVLLLSVVVFNVFVDSFPSPQDEGFGNLDKKADEILNDFDKQVNEQRQKRVFNLFRNFTQTRVGRGIDTRLSFVGQSNFGPDVHTKTTSTVTVSNGQSVIVNETIWTNSEGKQVGVYRVVIGKSVVSNTDNTEPSDKSASEVDDLNNTV